MNSIALNWPRTQEAVSSRGQPLLLLFIMAKRKRTNGSDYFQHDYASRGDIKILDLRTTLQWEGYGIYWALIEKLAEANGYLLLSKCQAIAYDLQIDEKKLSSVINDFGLFEKDQKIFWSSRLNDQLKHRGRLSDLRRTVGKKGGEANAKQLLSKSVAIGSILKESKVKESKVKEIYIREFVKLTHEEVEKLKTLMGSNFEERLDSLNDYIGSKGVKYKSHYHTLLAWWRKDHPRQKTQREVVAEFMKNPNNFS